MEFDFMPKPDDAIVIYIKDFMNDEKTVKDIVDYFDTKNIIVLNFEGIEKETIRRIVDFSHGAAISRGGQIIRATDNMFVLKLA